MRRPSGSTSRCVERKWARQHAVQQPAVKGEKRAFTRMGSEDTLCAERLVDRLVEHDCRVAVLG